MRIFIVAIIVVIFSWLQLIYPNSLTFWNIVPDFCLLTVWAVSIYYQPQENILWWALLAGLSLDFWYPQEFGMWSITAITVALTTLILHHRLLPSDNFISRFAVGAIALFIGLLILYLLECFGSDLTLFEYLKTFSRIYIIRYLIDLLLLLIFSYMFKKIMHGLRVQNIQIKKLVD